MFAGMELIKCYGLPSADVIFIEWLWEMSVFCNRQACLALNKRNMIGSWLQRPETRGFQMYFITLAVKDNIVYYGSIVFLKCTACDQRVHGALGAMTNGRRSLCTTLNSAQCSELLEGRTEKHLVTDVSCWLWSSRFWWPGHRPVLVRHQHVQVWRGVSKNREHGDVHLWFQGKINCKQFDL